MTAKLTSGGLRLSRAGFLKGAGVGGLALVVPSTAKSWPLVVAQTAAPKAANVVLEWNAALLQAVRESKLGPSIVSRALAVAHTCVYDAWAAYDMTAVGTQLGGQLRRPTRERTFENKQQAVSYAAYRAGVDLFPGSKTTVFDPVMAQL